jgi:hypothetical protein
VNEENVLRMLKHLLSQPAFQKFLEQAAEMQQSGDLHSLVIGNTDDNPDLGNLMGSISIDAESIDGLDDAMEMMGDSDNLVHFVTLVLNMDPHKLAAITGERHEPSTLRESIDAEWPW